MQSITERSRGRTSRKSLKQKLPPSLAYAQLTLGIAQDHLPVEWAVYSAAGSPIAVDNSANPLQTRPWAVP